MSATVIGLDPGLANLGVAIYRPFEDEMSVDIIRTRAGKGEKKTRSKADDRARRCAKIARSLRDIIQEHEPICVCAEEMTFYQSIKSALNAGLAWATVAATTALTIEPALVMLPTQTARLHAFDSKQVSKADVHEWATDRWPDAGWSDAKTRYKHQADASLIAWACAHHAPELSIALASARS